MSLVTVSKDTYSFTKYLSTRYEIGTLVIAGITAVSKAKSLPLWSSHSSGYTFQKCECSIFANLPKSFCRKLEKNKTKDIKILRNNDKSRPTFTLKHVTKRCSTVGA